MRKTSLFQRFMRFFFTHLYTTIAWSYDIVSGLVSIGQWKDWVLTAAQQVDSGPVLELGYGPGHLLLEGARHGWNRAGIDISGQMAKIAARRLRRHGCTPRAILGSAQHLPHPGRAFQHVLSTFPDEYITSEQTLAEIHRVLRPGGSLIIVAMSEITGAGILDRLAAWLFRFTGQTGPISDAWREPLKQAGFHPEIRSMQLPRSRVTLITGDRT
jgi:ubiquinone/menaquinone biosynthesis C-methylase UbiE